MATFNERVREINDLKSTRRTILDAARTALDAGTQDVYSAKMEEAGALNLKIEGLQTLLNEEHKYADNGKDSAPAPIEDAKENGKVRDMLASNEYANAFCNAVRNGATPQTAGGNENFAILMNALTETGGSPEGSSGGFLVPTEMQTKINEQQRSNISLSNLFNLEFVTTSKGFRVSDTAPTKGFTKVSEMGKIPSDSSPVFQRVEYSIEDYALIVPISNDLLADNTAGLLNYLARWISKKAIITENINLLALLGGITATNLEEGKELAGLKRALNVTLDPAFALTASIITNQNGFDFFDQLVDGNGRPLLQPSIADPTMFNIRGRKIHMISNAFLPDDKTKGTPIYVGDFAQFGTLIRRQNIEFATTNVGGNSWSTNSTEGRAIMRTDEIVQDSAAATKLFIPPVVPKA